MTAPPYDEAVIRSRLDSHASSALQGVEIHSSVGSTNTVLLDKHASGCPAPWACIADEQTAGRGRRGRAWHSPPGGNLYLSVLLEFPARTPGIHALGLAVGTAIAAALDVTPTPRLQLKWPNDLLHDGRKLGGILLESRAATNGTQCVVAGAGLNLRMSDAASEPGSIDQPWTDLRCALGHEVPRNVVAGDVLNAVLNCAVDYPSSGLAAWRDEFARRDALRGRLVTVRGGAACSAGIAQGIDADGALLVRAGSTVHRLQSGDVSVRVTSD